ncbi:MAG: chalcone isomerase family protein [Burkholderiaceae bacterium]
MSLTNASVRAPARRRLLGGLMCGLMAPLLVGGMLRTRPAQAMTSVGRGTLRVWGFKVYEAELLASAPGPDLQDLDRLFSRPFSLRIQYAREIQSRALIDRTIDEMRALKAGTAEQHAAWTRALNSIFPTVGEGDELVGEHVPGLGARFQFNGRPVGEVADEAFSRAFFRIWLDPQTSAPSLRKALLGLATP